MGHKNFNKAEYVWKSVTIRDEDDEQTTMNGNNSDSNNNKPLANTGRINGAQNEQWYKLR